MLSRSQKWIQIIYLICVCFGSCMQCVFSQKEDDVSVFSQLLSVFCWQKEDDECILRIGKCTFWLEDDDVSVFSQLVSVFRRWWVYFEDWKVYFCQEDDGVSVFSQLVSVFCWQEEGVCGAEEVFCDQDNYHHSATTNTSTTTYNTNNNSQTQLTPSAPLSAN